MLNFLRSQCESCDVKLKEVTQSSFHEALLDYEKKELVRKYKFGVLYVKEGQKTEDEMFSNSRCSFQRI